MPITQIKTPQIADTNITSTKLGVLTTKGDLLTFDSDHARIGVGTDGQGLVADSTQTTGLKWANIGRVLGANTSVPAGNTVANTTSETNFTSSISISANSLVAGQVIKVRAAGVLSTILSPSVTLKVKFGSVVLGTTGALVLALSSNAGWRLEFDINVFSIGSSGTMEGHGFSLIPSTLSPVLIANTSPTTVNTTNTTTLQVSAQWSALSLSNTITMRQFYTEIMG